MKWKTPLMLSATAIAASCITVFVMMNVEHNSSNNITSTTGSNQINSEQLMSEMNVLRQSVQMLQQKLETTNIEPNPDSQADTSNSDMPQRPTDGAIMPKMVMVDPTHEQNQTFEELKNLLDQPRYIESLNLNTLAKSEDMASLPRPLQLVIISKAIEKFNNGEVDRVTFMAK